jgi:hypothetical protein
MMLNLYRNLLRLYPAAHRAAFGEEMVVVFCELRDEAQSKKLAPRTAFYFREAGGAVAGALKEHWRCLMGDQARLLFPTVSNRRRIAMRNEFRFPKATALLMAIILAGVLVAIQKGESIEASLPDVSPPIGPIHPVHSTLMSGAILLWLLFVVMGMVGWAILFAMRRSGVHRLAGTSTDRTS